MLRYEGVSLGKVVLWIDGRQPEIISPKNHAMVVSYLV